jgi:uncharacterized protein (TIGR02246 family)
MHEDEEQIRTLIERWAEAVHAGDMDGVLADHADDIEMFDVPPPYDGVRGIDAYRETWPPFFDWQARGASFEIVSLDVTAGDEISYAHALLRCGTPQELADNPANRLRLSLGLHKEGGRWVVAHEYHSFPVPVDAGERTPLATWRARTPRGPMRGSRTQPYTPPLEGCSSAPTDPRSARALRQDRCDPGPRPP